MLNEREILLFDSKGGKVGQSDVYQVGSKVKKAYHIEKSVVDKYYNIMNNHRGSKIPLPNVPGFNEVQEIIIPEFSNEEGYVDGDGRYIIYQPLISGGTFSQEIKDRGISSWDVGAYIGQQISEQVGLDMTNGEFLYVQFHGNNAKIGNQLSPQGLVLTDLAQNIPDFVKKNG